MAFPTVQTSSKGTNADTSNHLVNLPSGIQVGDFIVVFLALSSAVSPTLSGWSADTITNGSGRSRIYRRIADGTEGATATFSGGSSVNSGYFAFRISGANGDIEGTNSATQSTATSTTPNPPSLTPSWGSDDYLWFAYTHVGDDNTFSVYPSGYSGGDSQIVDSGLSQAVAYRQANATSEDPGTFTMSASDTWYANTVAIRPSQGQTFSIDETLSLSETTSALRARNFTTSETLSLSETVTALKGIAFSVADTLGLVEAFTSSRTFVFNVAESLGLIELRATLKLKWNNFTKPTTTFTDTTKPSTTFSDQSKPSSTWTNKTK